MHSRLFVISVFLILAPGAVSWGEVAAAEEAGKEWAAEGLNELALFVGAT